MTGFCNSHVGERSEAELKDNVKKLKQLGAIGSLSPHKAKELERCEKELETR